MDITINVTKTTNHWGLGFPCYHVNRIREYIDVRHWAETNNVKLELLSSGANGYTFEVTNNHTLFELVWG